MRVLESQEVQLLFTDMFYFPFTQCPALVQERIGMLYTCFLVFQDEIMLINLG